MIPVAPDLALIFMMICVVGVVVTDLLPGRGQCSAPLATKIAVVTPWALLMGQHPLWNAILA